MKPVNPRPGWGVLRWRAEGTLKTENLMVLASTANDFRTAVSALRSLDGGKYEFSKLHARGGALCTVYGKETGQGYASKRPTGIARVPSQSGPGSHEAVFRPSRPEPRHGLPSQPQLIISVALRPEVSKLRLITDICSLLVSMEPYVIQMAH